MIVSNEILTGKTDSHINWLSKSIGIHKDMLAAFTQMQHAAANDNITLLIASGFRHYDRQLAIWQRKFSGDLTVKDKDGKKVDITKLSEVEKIKAIMLFSALPGASRHHWGCDIDVYAPNLLAKDQQLQLEPWEYQDGGPFYALTLWLEEHAKQFGFYFPYNKYRGGVATEPWHLSYFPLAQHFEQAYSLPLLTKLLSESDIAGKQTLIHSLPTIYQQYIINVATHK